MKLSETPLNNDVIVIEVDKTLKNYRRFMEMGLLKNSQLSVVMKTPLNDIIVVQIDSYLLAMRKEDSSKIIVRKILC